MNNIIGVINYGIAGNIHSVKKAIEKAGGKTLVINTPSDFDLVDKLVICLLYTSPSPRDAHESRMPSSA